MQIAIYDVDNTSANMRLVGITNRAIGSFTFQKYTIGTFSINISPNAPYAEQFKEDRVLLIDGEYWAVITGVFNADDSNPKITVSGSQLKEWAHRRVITPTDETLNTDVKAYDSASGATETIMKTAVDRHMINTADIRRKIIGLRIADDKNRGAPNDAYLYRYKYLDEALVEIGERNQIGWHIYGSPKKCDFVFDIIPLVDATIEQTIRKPVILQVARGTAKSASYTCDIGQSANVFYCTRSDSLDEWEKLTLEYTLDDKEYSGYRRRETALDISANTDSDNIYDDFETLAKQLMEGYRASQSISAEMSKQLVRGKDYDLGWLCTVQIGSVARANMEITTITVSYSSAQKDISATFGTPKITRFETISRRLKGGI